MTRLDRSPDIRMSSGLMGTGKVIIGSPGTSFLYSQSEWIVFKF
jgi:hypothetical protein